MSYPFCAFTRRIVRRGVGVAILLMLLGAAEARAALTFQNAASTSANSATTVTIPSFNPGGGGRRLLVVGLTFGQGAPPSMIVVYGGAPLTLAPGTSVTRGNAHTEIWYLANPPSTPSNIVALWTGNHDVVMGAVAFNGADQTTPVTNGTSANNTSTSISVTVTSAAGDMTMDTVSTLSGTLSAPTRNQQWLDMTPTTVTGAGSTAAGAASVTHAWTAGTSAAWTASAVNIKAAVLGYEVGNFVKTTAGATATQVVPHGLKQAPKAILLWTESRQDATFSGAPIVRAAQAGTATGILALTINKPAGTLQNDVMGAAIAIRPSNATVTAPAGWFLVQRTDNPNAGPTGNSLWVFGLIAGAAEPASYTFTLSASAGSVGTIFSVSGVDGFNAIDDSNTTLTASSLNQPAPSVTTTSPNDLILTLHTMASAATWTPPAGMTEAADVASGSLGTNGQSLELNYAIQANAGASGVKTAVASNDADIGIAVTFALRTAAQAYFGFGFSDGTTDGSVATSNQDSVATAVTARRMANKVLTVVKWDQTLLAEADLLSWNTSSFSLSWTTNDGLPYIIHYMLIGGSDVSAKVVSWQMPTATGNKAVTGVGFQPTAVIHIHAGSAFTAAAPATATDGAFGLGVMDFAGAQWSTSVLTRSGAAADAQRGQQTNAAVYTFDNTLAVTKRAQFVSMDAGGFTVNFTTAGPNLSRVFSLALKGVNVKAGSFLKSVGAAPATNQITGMGFDPSAVLLHSFQDITRAAPVANSRLGLGASDGTTEGSVTFSDLNAAVPTNVTAIDKIDKAFVKADNSTPVIDAEGEVSSLDADGFTVKWTTNDAVATQVLYLGLANLVNTEVRLVSFNATRYPRGVLLQWKTGAELDNLGFNLYREVDGVRAKVNASLIAGSGLSTGQGTTVSSALSYALWDVDQASASAGVTYWLEDLDLNGKITRHGPLVPVAGVLNGPEPTVISSGDMRDLSRRAKDRRVFISHSSNADMRRERRAGSGGSRQAARLQSAIAGEAAVKIGINRSGWYRVTQPELAAAGLSANVDPRYLRLFVDGAEQAIRVNAQVAGQFTAADSIEFYAMGLDTPYTDTRVYWLTAGVEIGQRIQVEGNPGGGGTVPARFLSTVRRKDRSIYFAALKNGDKENWFGPLVSPDPVGLTLAVHNLSSATTGTEPLSGRSAQLTVTLQGITNSDATGADHIVTVSVNGNEIGEMAFAGPANYAQTLEVPSYALIEGDNVVGLVARGGATDFSLVDELVLSYGHIYRADADLLRATVDQPGPVTIGGFADAAIRVVDITDPAAAIELTGAVQAEGNGLSSVSVRTSAAGPRTLLAFSSTTISAPLYVQANHASTWRNASQAHDYVVISHGNFVSQAAALAEFRQRQGRTPAVIDVADLYDEFSFGEKTPQAIKDFLQWARTNWQQAPRFVVLLGDATVDPRDYAGLGAADLVPTKQVPMAAVALETASDDWFVDFDDDGLPDLAIGRLSVRTADQAATTISKITKYEQRPAAPWMKDVLLVAGEGDDTSNFGQLSESLSALVPPSYTVQRVFTDTLGTVDAHQALVDRVNEGQLIVNYTGHGSTQFWGLDQSLLNNDDVTASWRNAAKLPFVIAMNCLNGLFNQIFGGNGDEASLAEALQRAPEGGAVAVWASSSATPPATQALVNQELFRLIFSGAYSTLGEAVAAAKQVVTNPDLRKSWIFFGDPATQLNGTPQATDWPQQRPVPPPVDSPDHDTHTPATIDVAANDDLQGAINRAVPGDTIRLEAGATFVGNFVLPAKSGAGYVTIRSATPDAALPGVDTRIGPAQAPLLAKITSPNANAALRTAPAAHHYRLLFLEFGPNSNGEGDIIQLGDGSGAQNALAGVPHDLELDRVYIHGDAVFGQQRAIGLNSASTIIANSYIAGIKSADVRAQALSGWNGPGPYTIVNNYIESAGANLQLGGAASSVPNLVASDVSLRLNELRKPAARLSQSWPMASLIVLNGVERVTIDGNVLEHNGGSVEAGAALLLMPRDGHGGPSATVAHVQFTNNIVRRAPAGIIVLDPTRSVTDVSVRNNLFADLTDRSTAGGFLRVTGGLDITVDHNTVLLAGPSGVYASGIATIGFAFTNNILPDNGGAVAGVGTTAGNGTIQRYFLAAIWAGNLVAGAPASAYPSGNAYPESLASIGLVTLPGGNYGLADSSPFRGASIDGANPGYDAFALVSAAQPPAVVTSQGHTMAIAVPPSLAATEPATPSAATAGNRVAARSRVPASSPTAMRGSATRAPAPSRAPQAAAPPATTLAVPAQPAWGAASKSATLGPRPVESERGVSLAGDGAALPPTELEPSLGASIDTPTVSKLSRVLQVELKSDSASPYIAGTAIAVIAEPAGGAGPYQYQWRVFDGRTWSLPSEWSSFASFTWTPDPANAAPGIMVGVRSAGSNDDKAEAHQMLRIVIAPGASAVAASADVKP